MALTKVSRGLLSTSIVDNGTATAITIDSSENVGIGTTSPSSLLHLSSAGSTVLNVEATGANDSRLRITSGNSNTSYVEFADPDDVDTGEIRYEHATNNMQFRTAGNVERMRIDSSGRVGIGTSSPSVPVHVYKSQASPTIVAKFENPADEAIVEIKSKNTDLGVLQFADTEDANVGAVQYSHSDNSMRFKTNDSERMRIDASGNVSIGTSATSAPLRVNVGTDQNCAINTSGGNPRITAFNDAVTASVPLGFNGSILKFETGGSERMRIDSSGNLNIGTTGDVTSTNAGIQLRADNTIRVAKSGLAAMSIYRHTNNGSIISFYRDATNVGSISVTSSATTYNTSSDQRLKENIADADDAGSKIDAIQVRQYDWKADGSHQDYGMIAQELQTVAPEAVSGDADSEDMMGVDYSKLVPMLIKEIQSLRNRVAQLEE